ncbi:unnamed protein product, partial [Mesorhabditis belari]|uniref:Major facilitator superfamily (MFS) profile domain-containing protein n=1 Tax=Mesorhabditis belari TaxID=2138241 RepID=A0AAF3JB37_9BILA
MQRHSLGRRSGCAVFLIITNILNYIDRFTLPSVLTDVQKYFSLGDTGGGLLQTIFIIFFMIASAFGHLGDRYNRKSIMLIGISLWSISLFASSFIPSTMFWLFVVLRGIVGIGMAAFSCISLSVIADLFSSTTRSMIYMIFCFAVPLGAGVGYMIGSALASYFNQWQYAIRLTPAIGTIFVIVGFLLLVDPERGANEFEEINGKIDRSPRATFWTLITNFTFVLSTMGYTGMVFVAGTTAWWLPTAVLHSEAARLNHTTTDDLSSEHRDQVNMTFGSISCLGGLVGVVIGSLLSEALRRGTLKIIPPMRQSDPFVCFLGASLSAGAFIMAFYYMAMDLYKCYLFLLIAVTGLSFNWAIIVTLTYSVVAPYRRNAASSWQIFFSHAFGDSCGPYIIGMASDYLPFLFLAASFTINNDMEKCKMETEHKANVIDVKMEETKAMIEQK